MLKEDTSYSSPIATLFYEYYDSFNNLTNQLHIDKEKIQCIVSHKKDTTHIKFGQTQHPKLWDYADGIDTLEFLLKL
jgi:hypothetical protein